MRRFILLLAFVGTSALGQITSTGTIIDDDSDFAAFTGAEGFGAFTEGGRGGYVCVVSNTNNSGAGSFRECLTDTQPRIIVFRTSGVITLTSNIQLFPSNSYVTVLGETSPGGITLTGGSIGNYGPGDGDVPVTDMIFRNLRIRRDGGDTFAFNIATDILLDHVDISGSSDEVLDLGRTERVTVQWSSVSNSKAGAGSQNYGSLIAYKPNQDMSLHHNLFAHHGGRCMAQVHFGSGPSDPDATGADWDVKNNVIYNCGSQQALRFDNVTSESVTLDMNYVGNYGIVGPDSGGTNQLVGGDATGDLYVSDNTYTVGGTTNISSNSAEHDFGQYAVTTTSAAQALVDVLESVGAWPRDAMMVRTVSDVENEEGTLGVISDALSTDAPGLATDTDSDGIPDAWEDYIGSDDSVADADSLHSSGYAYAEVYANELRANLNGADTLLEELAAYLAPNQSIYVYGEDDAFVSTEGDTTLQWASSALWNEQLKKIRFIGKRQSTFPYHAFEYDAASNDMVQDGDWDVAAGLAVGQSGHGYDNNAIDPATGDIFFRTSGTTYYIWDESGSSWSSNTFPQSVNLGGVSWVPSLGWVWCESNNFKHSTNGTSWTDLNSDFCGWTDGGQYHAITEYNETADVLLVGAGNNSDVLYKWDVAGESLTTIATPPFNLGSAATQGTFTAVPDEDRFIGRDKDNGNAWTMYDVSENSWTTLTESTGDGSSPQTGTPNLSSFHNTIATPIDGISTPGITAWVHVSTTSGNVELWLYRAPSESSP